MKQQCRLLTTLVIARNFHLQIYILSWIKSTVKNVKIKLIFVFGIQPTLSTHQFVVFSLFTMIRPH